ncbi:YkgJ family cysteine cluster protein [Pseudomonas putida]
MSVSTQISLPHHDARPAFHCTGCGACCKGRFVPLTLEEARQWLQRGHEVAVLLEAFDAAHWPQSPQAHAYNVQRSAQVACGGEPLQVIVILAGQAIPRCPNLRDDDLCSLYAERPQVCRIYPMEINPFIALRIDAKECPPEAWEAGQVLASDRAADRELSEAIAHSRQSDRDDAQAKLALCEDLGLTTAAWKGNGLAIYFPAREALLAGIERKAAPRGADWQVRVVDPLLRQQLQGLAFDEREQMDYLFHPVPA